MKYLIFIISLLISNNLFSQIGGETLYPFLNTSTSPKQIALGGVILTSRDDVSQTLWNPSSVDSLMEGDVALNYVNYVSGIKVGSVSYAKAINPKYGIAFMGIQYFNYGDFERTDATGPTVLGNFSARDLSFNLGYGYTYQMVSVGFSLKYISSNIDTYNSTAFLYDFGLTYTDPNEPFVASIVIRNSGKTLTKYLFVDEPIQNNVIVAMEYSLKHVPIKVYGAIDELNNWDIAVPNPTRSVRDIETEKVTSEDISIVNNALRHLSIGLELWPKGNFNVRAGYNHRKAQEYQLKEARTGAALSYGFSFKSDKYKIEFARAKFQEGAKYSTFGLTLHL